MHSARIDNSKRLQRVDSLLSDGKEYTTMEIVVGARVCAVNSCIAELRANGRKIVCRRQKDVWYYKMVTEVVNKNE
jgi:hypothetical protein